MANDDADVSEEPTPQLVAAETTVRQLPLEQPEHIRIGGQPGLRVHHQGIGGVTQVKRVTAGNDEPMGVTLPMATMRSLAAVFAEEGPDAAAKLAAVHALLKPFLR